MTPPTWPVAPKTPILMGSEATGRLAMFGLILAIHAGGRGPFYDVATVVSAAMTITSVSTETPM